MFQKNVMFQIFFELQNKFYVTKTFYLTGNLMSQKNYVTNIILCYFFLNWVENIKY
jgi:hypothetical protein